MTEILDLTSDTEDFDKFPDEAFDKAVSNVNNEKALTEDNLELIAEQSAQPRAAGDKPIGGFSPVILLRSGSLLPPWWSRSRDSELRKFWRRSDALSGAMYNFITRAKSIPFSIVPRDATNKTSVKMALEWEDKLKNEIELFQGWNIFLQKLLEDYLGTDNGFFFEMVGEGDKDEMLVGGVDSILNLDSTRCLRTDNPMWPVKYYPVGGDPQLYHFSRIAFASQLPSSDEEMFGVGFCAISRCVNAAQNLVDIQTYLQEKLGSRPSRGLIVAKGGLDPEMIGQAVAQAMNVMDDRGLQRYSPVAIVGSQDIPDGDLDIKDLASIPDGFDLKEDTVVGMALIALAFGVDARELFPAMGVGATRADAIVQHVKQRGKGIADVLSVMKMKINQWVLPESVEIIFDFVDDAQDRQRAEIGKIRSETRSRDLETGITDIRVERERMVQSDEITLEQFVQLELKDGRLENGQSVLMLFASDDPAIQSIVQLPNIKDPLNVNINDASEIQNAVSEKRAQAFIIMQSSNAKQQRKIREAVAALDALEKLYIQQSIQQGDPSATDISESNSTESEVPTMNDEEEALAQDLDIQSEASDATKSGTREGSTPDPF